MIIRLLDTIMIYENKKISMNSNDRKKNTRLLRTKEVHRPEEKNKSLTPTETPRTVPMVKEH